ncbi:acyltransferase family protein [Luteolibacter luteus]|uniref:Acyltransferase family protein n=1 Tax=Luteolibacter luteus TaxID=2728835 RepID=A0A858RLL2_9BACT|nr:acyltransferase family protein [Luteolibacter luteus]QJE97070.1 acyltransferase family protein [Luteolibacter luteus]
MTHAKSLELVEPALPQAEARDVSFADHGGKKSERFFHLDALRAGLMFWGILVHASTVENSPVFRAIAEVSGLVRMEAFFVISGFLAYMLLKKYGAKVTVKKRLLAIGLPFVTALVLLNPATNYIVYCYHNTPIPFMDYLAGKGSSHPKGPMNWHLHLWFLAALFIYSLLAPVIGRAVDGVMRASYDRIPRPWTLGKLAPVVPGLKFLALCLMVCGGCVGARVAFESIKPLLHPEAHYVVRSIGNFLPYYALGMVLFASIELRNVFSKARWFQTLLSCVLLYLSHRASGENPGKLGEVAILAAQTYTALCLSSLLFWLAAKLVRKENPWARSLSDAAYTVYLFHFLSLYLFATLLRPWIHATIPLLVAISIATFATTLCFHRFVIWRVPILELLFNGKPLRPSR